MSRPSFEEHWRRRFTERGERFDDDAGIAGWTETGLETRLRQFRRVWGGDAPGARWLDAGCGAGSYTRFLAASRLEPIGLDYSLPSVRKAQARSEAGAVHWLAGDATRLPMRDGALDGVLCFGVVQALAGPERALRELLRVVRPGGQVWVDALNRRCATTLARGALAKLRGQALPLRYDDPHILVRLLEAGGATDIRVWWVPILPGFLRRLQPLVETAPVRQLFARLPWLGALCSHAVLFSAIRGRA